MNTKDIGADFYSGLERSLKENHPELTCVYPSSGSSRGDIVISNSGNNAYLALGIISAPGITYAPFSAVPWMARVADSAREQSGKAILVSFNKVSASVKNMLEDAEIAYIEAEDSGSALTELEPELQKLEAN